MGILPPLDLVPAVFSVERTAYFKAIRPRAKPVGCVKFGKCGRYRLTRRRMLEIEQYYQIDRMEDLEIWQREYNFPPREIARVVLEWNTPGVRTLFLVF
jgi:hypothetical protein